MRQQSFIILLLGASVCLSWGQNNPKKYYEYINKAELAYLQMSDDNDLGQKAAQYYEKAFAANRPFSKDLRYYLSLYADNKQGCLDVALECAHILAQRGMLWPKWYDADTAFQHTLYLIKDTTRVITDPKLVATLDSLRARDQRIRTCSRQLGEDADKATVVTDSVNMQSLIELFRQYGYLNEDNAGELYANIIELIFIHNSKTRTAELPFDVVEKAVKEGTYDARSYMDFYDECLTWRCPGDTICETRYGLGFNSNMVIGNTLFIYPTGDVKEIDAYRKALGVSETYADYEKKLENAFLSKGARFITRLYIANWGDEEEDAQAAAEARADIDSCKVKGRYVIKQ